MLDFRQNEARFTVKDVHPAVVTPRNNGVRSICKDDTLSVCRRRLPYFQSSNKSPSVTVKPVYIKPIGNIINDADATLSVYCGIPTVP